MNSPHGNWILAIDADVTAPVPVEEGRQLPVAVWVAVCVRLGVSSAVYTGLQPARIDAHRHAVNSWSGLIIRGYGLTIGGGENLVPSRKSVLATALPQRQQPHRSRVSRDRPASTL